MSEHIENKKLGTDQPRIELVKRTYSRPTLSKFGKVGDITAGGGSSNGEGGAMMA
jgi:hypothetical protein